MNWILKIVYIVGEWGHTLQSYPLPSLLENRFHLSLFLQRKVKMVPTLHKNTTQSSYKMKTTTTSKGAADRGTGACADRRNISVNPDFKRICTKLELLHDGPDKHRQTLTLWYAQFKGLLSQSEIKRMFEAFSGDLGQLHALSPRILEWSKESNTDNFSPKWLASVFKKHGIQTIREIKVKPEKLVSEHKEKSEPLFRKLGRKKTAKAVYVAPSDAPLDLKDLTDDQLLNIQCQIQEILDERAERARKKASFLEALEIAGVTAEEALEFLGIVWKSSTISRLRS